MNTPVVAILLFDRLDPLSESVIEKCGLSRPVVVAVNDRAVPTPTDVPGPPVNL